MAKTRRYSIAFLLLVFIQLSVRAQLAMYALDTIPAPLLQQAHSVKQYERIEFTVADMDKATLTGRQVLTVLDAKGSNDLSFVEYSTKYAKVEDLQVTVFNKLGLPANRYNKKDFRQDISNSNMVDDLIIYHLKISASEYPITVEYTYSVKYKGILRYPSFDIQQPGQAVRHAEFVAVIPKQLGLRYKNQLVNIVPEIKDDPLVSTYTWKAKDLVAIKDELGTVSKGNCFPKILLAPNKFRLDNYAGDMSSWEAFSAWGALLTEHTLDLPEATKAMFRDMVKDLNNPVDKARVLYSYLQDNFRYVSIQLGIGGFKPFAASYTDKMKYGDCKALSNYMQASLAAVGIKSYQAWINAGYNAQPADPAFSADVFNHVILCMPLEKDTVWLECTSQKAAFGQLGNFTENRNALLLMPSGGMLVPTPRSQSMQNQMGIHAMANLANDGSGKVTTRLTASGEDREKLLYYLQNESADNQKQELIDMLDIAVPETFSLQLGDARADSLQAIIDMSFEKIPAFSAGSKFFLHPQLHKVWQYSLPKSDKRTQDYYFSHPFIKSDTTVYQLPEGFEVESMPEPRKLETKHTLYQSGCKYDAAARQIIVTARLQLYRQQIPAYDYQEVYDFFARVIGDGTTKIVVRKSGE